MRQEDTTVTEAKMFSDHVRNDNIRETEGREHHREVQESKIEVVWTREDTRPRLLRKTNTGDGTTWEKKKRKTEAEMDGLCQPRHESYRDNKLRMKSMTGLAGGELCALLRPHN